MSSGRRQQLQKNRPFKLFSTQREEMSRDNSARCLKQSSRYTCPRCNIPYCTLACYKGKEHSTCSETFYKENFLQALKETKSSADEKKKILEILQRVEDSNQDLDSDDEDSNDVVADSLAKRLAGIDLDHDAHLVWEKLTEKEKKEFEEVLQAGHLGDMLETWIPWWTHHDKGLIVDLNPHQVEDDTITEETSSTNDRSSETDSSSTSSSHHPCPKILAKIPRLSALLKSSRPSDLVVYNITNVLYCYAYIARLYNGAHMDLPLQATQSMVDLSSVLSTNHNFSSTEDAVHSAINRISHNSAHMGNSSLVTSILQDVIHILLGQDKDNPLLYTKAALSDLHRLMGAAKRHLTQKTSQLHKNSSQASHPAQSSDPTSDARREEIHELTTSSQANHSAQSSDPVSSNTREGMAKLRSNIFQCRKKVEFFLAWTCRCGEFLAPVAAELQLLYKSRLVSEEQHNKQQALIEETWGGQQPPTKSKSGLIQEL